MDLRKLASNGRKPSSNSRRCTGSKPLPSRPVLTSCANHDVQDALLPSARCCYARVPSELLSARRKKAVLAAALPAKVEAIYSCFDAASDARTEWTMCSGVLRSRLEQHASSKVACKFMFQGLAAPRGVGSFCPRTAPFAFCRTLSSWRSQSCTFHNYFRNPAQPYKQLC